MKADWIVHVEGRCEETLHDAEIFWICKESEGHDGVHRDVWFGHVKEWPQEGERPPG